MHRHARADAQTCVVPHGCKFVHASTHTRTFVHAYTLSHSCVQECTHMQALTHAGPPTRRHGNACSQARADAFAQTRRCPHTYTLADRHTCSFGHAHTRRCVTSTTCESPTRTYPTSKITIFSSFLTESSHLKCIEKLVISSLPNSAH